jgi:hypothetical protein
MFFFIKCTRCTRCTLKKVRTVRIDARVDVRFCSLYVRNEYGNTALNRAEI